MSVLLYCSSCCAALSVWAIIQLTVMGICYQMNATVLLEDVEPRDGYSDYYEFIYKVKTNYAAVATNCWIVAAIYAVVLLLSCLGLYQAKKSAKKEATRREDDEYNCHPQEKKVRKRKNRRRNKKTENK